MRVCSSRHAAVLWAVVAAWILVAISPVSAQDWFRQRSYDGQAAPVTIDMAKKAIDEIRRAATVTPATPPVARVFPAAIPTPIPIPDNNQSGVSSTLSGVPAIPTYVSVAVSLNITHPFIGDLIVTLTSPDGSVFPVHNHAGGATDNLVLTNQPVPVAAGSSVQGNWVLKVFDTVADDTGSLVSWSLTVNVPSAAAGSLIDLTISLEADPAGDNNGNTQGVPGSAAQDKWERIVQYFADAVYEMTEGGHKIRQVRIFKKSRNFGAADIRWSAKGHPHVPSNGGVGVSGGHVEMFEIFQGGGAGGADYDMLADEIGSGYTMGHEWGHFFLGLYDEYNPACGTTTVSVSPSIMTSQWNARAGDHQWLNFSIKRQSGGSFQDTLLNCQHFAYGASAWDVLARPASADPVDQISKGFQALGPRIAYPELASFAPAGTATPRNDLDLAGANARSALDIVWMTDVQTMEIVIDHSGSMSVEDRLINAQTAAKLLVDQAVLGQSRIGVTQFDDTVQSVFPQTLVTTEDVRRSIKAAIDGIQLGGLTNIGDAANAALAKILAVNAPAGENRVVFLLTDGQSNFGAPPLSVIPAYVAAHVPLFTFGFGADADSVTLSQMASGTGGRFFFSPTTLAQIVAAFQAANAVASSTPSLGAGTLSPTTLSDVNQSIMVDSTVDRMQLSVTYTGTPLPSTALGVTPPNSTTPVAPTQLTTTGTGTSANNLAYFDIPQPADGPWQLHASTAAAGRNVSYSVTAIQAGVGYDVNTGLRDSGLSVLTPGPIVIESRLTHRQPVTGATVTSVVTPPTLADGTPRPPVPVQLTDNGVYPDLVDGDGVYTGSYTPNAPGSHSLTVQFSNPNHQARETYHGANLSPNPSGGAGIIPNDTIVVEEFTRSQTIQFSIDTVVTDTRPTLTTQPANRTVPKGSSVSFIVTAIGSPAPTYQWQRKAVGAVEFTPVLNGGVFSGATTGTLTITGATLAMSGDQFRCVVTNGVAPAATSNEVTLTVVLGPAVVPRKDFDGDGKAELGIFRPANGTWYTRNSAQGYNTGTAGAFQWGLPGDMPVSGDFDGDGKLELTIFRPANGTWYIRYSTLGFDPAAAQTFQWGLPGDVPIGADFDGDTKTDIAIWRPATGSWYIRYSSLGFVGTTGFFQWGLPGDVPLTADFDGDGRADLAIWRPVNGTWYVRFSTQGYAIATAAAVQWGLQGDVPISADFDADGTTDLAIWRPANGTWYIRYSSLGFVGFDAFQWGLQGDVPVAADFDGDGKTDLTIWRPANGTWYIRYSSLGFVGFDAFQWGLPGDIPSK